MASGSHHSPLLHGCFSSRTLLFLPVDAVAAADITAATAVIDSENKIFHSERQKADAIDAAGVGRVGIRNRPVFSDGGCQAVFVSISGAGAATVTVAILVQLKGLHSIIDRCHWWVTRYPRRDSRR